MVEIKSDQKTQTGEQGRWTYSNPDTTIPGIEEAMRRATMKARRRAIALTGRVVTIRNGKVEYDTEP
ncbi:MAG: hypothetical protein F4X66_18530 [Chloroflexi bacterium]|nr:hypothetical protein [Chloroflexota bacterium]MYE39280.1 hypothetical protein [Chloroflexota bacterium]